MLALDHVVNSMQSKDTVQLSSDTDEDMTPMLKEEKRRKEYLARVRELPGDTKVHTFEPRESSASMLTGKDASRCQ